MIRCGRQRRRQPFEVEAHFIELGDALARQDRQARRAVRQNLDATFGSSLSSASRTGITLVPKTSASERVGSVSPGENRPSRIACLSVR